MNGKEISCNDFGIDMIQMGAKYEIHYALTHAMLQKLRLWDGQLSLMSDIDDSAPLQRIGRIKIYLDTHLDLPAIILAHFEPVWIRESPAASGTSNE